MNNYTTSTFTININAALWTKHILLFTVKRCLLVRKNSASFFLFELSVKVDDFRPLPFEKILKESLKHNS